jgi:Universal stress protein family
LSRHSADGWRGTEFRTTNRLSFGGCTAFQRLAHTKIAIQAIMPEVYEPVPGEVVAFGLSLENSDFGNGALSLRAYLAFWRTYTAAEQISCQNSPIDTRIYCMTPDGLPAAVARAEQDVEQLAKQLESEGALHGVTMDVTITVGSVWPTISNVIAEQNPGLLVLGTHGRSGLGKFVLGSGEVEVFQGPMPNTSLFPRTFHQNPRTPCVMASLWQKLLMETCSCCMF